MNDIVPEDTRRNSRRLALRLLGVVVLMFGFGFALVPLYDVFCDVLGINGKTATGRYEYSAGSMIPDRTRTVRVQFVALNSDGLSWKFQPGERELKVHPGQAVSTFYYAHNSAGRDMVAHAVPSVSPGPAAAYFHKTECFCFEQQALSAGEEREMPLRFIIDPDLPKKIGTITLSYTLFDVTAAATALSATAGPDAQVVN